MTSPRWPHTLSALLLTLLAAAAPACDAPISFDVQQPGPDPADAGGDGNWEDDDATAPAPDVNAPDGEPMPTEDTGSPPDSTEADAVELQGADAPDDDADAVDTGSVDEDAADTGVDVEEPAPTLVSVAHPREFRGVWVATVSNINFPSRQGLTANQLRAELAALVDVTATAGLNAIVFQVRPEADALYASSIEPWSRYLTGTQGGDPGLDPLAELITLAHARNIEVHAWLNPYRAKANRSSSAVAPHLAVTQPGWAYVYGNTLWMDPGAAPVQDRLLEVVADLVRRYALDGVHFDDYFYPYPDGPFPDDVSFNAYTAAGGTLARNDWRRQNVNHMVRDVNARILDLDSTVRFGISPFGIYRPGIPPGITGLDQYNTLFADPVRWMEEGWLDYVAPQLYWPTTRTAQAYQPLLRWWTTVHPDLYVFTGNYLSQLGTSSDWTVDEFRAQLRISRELRNANSMGNIWFQIRPLQTNLQEIARVFREEFYPTPAVTPPLVSAIGRAVAVPTVRRGDGDDVLLTHNDPVPLRAWGVYRMQGDTWVLDRLLPPNLDNVALPGGPWAVSAITRHSVESMGVLVAAP